LGQFFPCRWAHAPEKEEEGETNSSQSRNIESCNIVLDYSDTTSSDSEDMFTTLEHEVLHAEGSTKELQLQEVNMNLRSGKVLPEPLKATYQDVDYNIVAHLK
jgi:hypothetical protein